MGGGAVGGVALVHGKPGYGKGYGVSKGVGNKDKIYRMGGLLKISNRK
jgi:hypothetical protein